MIIKQDSSGSYLAVKLIPETKQDETELRNLHKDLEQRYHGRITTDFHSVEKGKVISTNVILE